jgi:flagellar basal body rod protein FlgG
VGSEISTVQSLRAVDAWIDVINANINGGVRTAFKSSRLKFSGTNTDLQRAGTTTSLPLQFPEPGLATTNTVIDFTPGAIVASPEETHFAIQGNPSWFFMTVNKGEAVVMTGPNGYSGGAGQQLNPPRLTQHPAGIYITRDGEFHWGALEDLGDGVQAYYLKDTWGNYVVNASSFIGNAPSLYYDNSAPGVSQSEVVRWRGVGTLAPTTGPPTIDASVGSLLMPGLAQVTNTQTLQFSRFGSTLFVCPPLSVPSMIGAPSGALTTFDGFAAGALLTKSLEASNASMTQSVPELSLAQKLFSALTKVLQTKQTNVDGVLNLVR